jgi:hypothetical protein
MLAFSLTRAESQLCPPLAMTDLTRENATTQASAHARQHKEVTAKDAEGCFSAVPACPPWSPRKRDEGGKESLDRKWVALDTWH